MAQQATDRGLAAPLEAEPPAPTQHRPPKARTQQPEHVTRHLPLEYPGRPRPRRAKEGRARTPPHGKSSAARGKGGKKAGKEMPPVKSSFHARALPPRPVEAESAAERELRDALAAKLRLHGGGVVVVGGDVASQATTGHDGDDERAEEEDDEEADGGAASDAEVDAHSRARVRAHREHARTAGAAAAAATALAVSEADAQALAELRARLKSTHRHIKTTVAAPAGAGSGSGRSSQRAAPAAERKDTDGHHAGANVLLSIHQRQHPELYTRDGRLKRGLNRRLKVSKHAVRQVAAAPLEAEKAGAGGGDGAAAAAGAVVGGGDTHG